jgi:hypothetical protein
LNGAPDQDMTDDIAHLSLQSKKIRAALFCGGLACDAAHQFQ